MVSSNRRKEQSEEREDDASGPRLSEPVPRSVAERDARTTLRVPADAEAGSETAEPCVRIVTDDDAELQDVDASWGIPPSQSGAHLRFSRMPTHHPSARPTRPASAVALEPTREDGDPDGSSDE
jgi:hypothetical protein